MMFRPYQSLFGAILLLSTGVLAANVQADIVGFHFTGRLTVVNAYDGQVIPGSAGAFLPISAFLTVNTAFVSGGSFEPGAFLGTSTLNVDVESVFFGGPVTIHDVSLSYGGNATVIGNFLADWGNNVDMPVQVEWDATGLASAVQVGLQVGDRISGDTMWRDTGNDGVADTQIVSSLGSATPYSDSLSYDEYLNFVAQGPAPLAATGASEGLGPSTPFPGIQVLLDIGSGNSLTVTSIRAVPVPGAIWLSGSTLLGLVGLFRCRHA